MDTLKFHKIIQVNMLYKKTFYINKHVINSVGIYFRFIHSIFFSSSRNVSTFRSQVLIIFYIVNFELKNLYTTIVNMYWYGGIGVVLEGIGMVCVYLCMYVLKMGCKIYQSL